MGTKINTFNIGDKVICVSEYLIVPNDKIPIEGLYLNAEYTISDVDVDMVYVSELPFERLYFTRFRLSRKHKIDKIMAKLKQKEEEITTTKTCYTCIDCGWGGEATECAIEEEWNEFRGTSMLYPVCPKCGGTVES